MKLVDLNLDPVEYETKDVYICGQSVKIKNKLSMAEKVQLIEYVLNQMTDPNTGVFSPVRGMVYLTLALVNWYTDIEFTDEDQATSAPDIFDLLQYNHVIEEIERNIDVDDFNVLSKLLDQSVEECKRFNYSALGIMQNLSSSSNDLVEQAQKMLDGVKNREGIELLGAIKDIVGQN